LAGVWNNIKRGGPIRGLEIAKDDLGQYLSNAGYLIYLHLFASSFSKICGDIRNSRCTTSVVDSSLKIKKIFSQKSLKYFVWTPLGITIRH
jgi:hypothetical protein